MCCSVYDPRRGQKRDLPRAGRKQDLRGRQLTVDTEGWLVAWEIASVALTGIVSYLYHEETE